MSNIPHFAAYAAAFEESYASDDWSLVEPFFTEDAAYEVGLEPPMGATIEGREQIVAFFEDVVNRFDRRFASRELALLEGPMETGNSIWIHGRATYKAPGVPNLVLVLKEIIRFEGGRICHLEDQYEPAMLKEIAEYLQAHGEKLGIVAE